MFKRLTRKQERIEREEELGLDDETKQVLGMHDTDSDESDTDSDSDSDLDSDLDAGSELDGEGVDAQMRMEWLAAEGGGSEDEDESDEEGLDLDEELDDEPPVVLSEALKNPIYLVSMDPDVRACIACPKKLLKNGRMVEVHIESAAHVRRYAKFCELAQNRKYRSKDPRRIAAAISQKQKAAPANAEGLSHRSLKRKAKLEAIKKKRTVTKQIIERKRREREKKAVPAAEDSGGASDSGQDEATSERPQKRQKIAKKDKIGDESASIPRLTKEETPKPRTKKAQKMKGDIERKEQVGSEAASGATSDSKRKPKGGPKAKTPRIKPTAADDTNRTANADLPTQKAESSNMETQNADEDVIAENVKPIAPSDRRPPKAKKIKDKNKNKTSKKGPGGAQPKGALRCFAEDEKSMLKEAGGPGTEQAVRTDRLGNGKGERQDGKPQNKRKRKGSVMDKDLIVFD
ncbi:hypothetical protein M0805_005867 [Coniferiporia weirii]|nr:hypothetical protein M0805_005867 [Coniferiporia weirii]